MSADGQHPPGTGGFHPGERIAFGWGIHTPAVPPAAAPTAVPAKAAPATPTRAGRAVTHKRRDWAYLGLLAFTAILFFRPQDVFPSLEALHLAEMSALVGLGALINGRLARREPVLPLAPEIVGILAFAGIMLALVPFSIWPGGSLAMLLDLYLKVVLIFILMAGTLTSAARLDRFVWLIVLASAYLGFRGVFDYARGLNLVEHARVAGAVGGVFSNPNDLALNMVAFLPPALLAIARRGRPSRRLVAAVASLLMFVTIVFTKSRGGFLGMGAMLLVLLVQGGRVRRGFGLAVFVAILVATPLLPASFWARMESITDDSVDPTGSREARRTVMREAWQVFLERPLTGVGPGEFKDYNPAWRRERSREAHDAWLQVASETGLFGTLVFVSLVIMAARDARSASRALSRSRTEQAPARGSTGAAKPKARARHDDASSVVHLYATAMMASIAGWIVCATFASVAYTWTFYYVFGIAMATRQIAGRAAAPARRTPIRARPSTAAA
jgi:O-antigen ligase